MGGRSLGLYIYLISVLEAHQVLFNRNKGGGGDYLHTAIRLLSISICWFDLRVSTLLLKLEEELGTTLLSNVATLTVGLPRLLCSPVEDAFESLEVFRVELPPPPTEAEAASWLAEFRLAASFCKSILFESGAPV